VKMLYFTRDICEIVKWGNVDQENSDNNYSLKRQRDGGSGTAAGSPRNSSVIPSI
jgi:hypothetical protein